MKKIAELLLVKDTELYKEIVLTPEEIEEALMLARQKKHGEMKRAEYVKKVNRDPNFITYTSGEMLKNIQEHIKLKPGIFDMDEHNQSIIIELCKYFTGDKTCIYDLKKGLLMQGPVGCGKTTLMKMFRFNQVSSYAVISTRTVSYDFTKNGYDGIYRYFGLIPTSDVYKSYGQGHVGICFDDLGTEVDKKHYGNESNVMAEVLLSRYDNRLSAKTHLTTNLSIEQLEERYGIRVRSRLTEMFNQVVFSLDSPDRRKKEKNASE